MRATHRTMLFFVTLRLVFGVVFLASAFGHWTVPWYLPLEHRWEIAASVQGVGMDWYGRSAVAFGAGALVGCLAWVVAGTARGARVLGRPGVVRDIAHLGALMLASDVAFYVGTMVMRHITPIPLPGWYCP